MTLTRIPASMLQSGALTTSVVVKRLSPTTESFPETDVSSSGTIYYGDLTLSISSALAGKNYDVFLSPSDTLVMGPAWTNNITRSSTVSEVDGVIVNDDAIGSMPAGAGKLIGGFRAYADGLTRSTARSRLVWSLDGATIVPVRCIDTTDSWTYSTAAYRQVNGNASNQVEIFNGVSGRMVEVVATGYMINGTSSVVAAFVGIGIDSSTADSAQIKNPGAAGNTFPVLPPRAHFSGYLGLGYHELRWLEKGAGGSQNWYGDGGYSDGYQTGLIGWAVV